VFLFFRANDITDKEIVRILQEESDKDVIDTDEEKAVITKSDHMSESKQDCPTTSGNDSLSAVQEMKIQ
jgi:hypothetical protein